MCRLEFKVGCGRKTLKSSCFKWSIKTKGLVELLIKVTVNVIYFFNEIVMSYSFFL